MEDLFKTSILQYRYVNPSDSNPRGRTGPVWARVSALLGGLALVAAGLAFIVLGVYLEVTW